MEFEPSGMERSCSLDKETISIHQKSLLQVFSHCPLMESCMLVQGTFLFYKIFPS